MHDTDLQRQLHERRYALGTGVTGMRAVMENRETRKTAFRKSEFENVVKAYSPELYRYAYWQCRDRFLAEDLVQETFARAWQAWEKLRDERVAKSWLYTILRHEQARLFERKRVEIDDTQELDEIVDTAASSAYDRLEMRDALKALPTSYREPLLLQVLGGFSCAEIAGMMDSSEGAVMTRLSRARLALRKMLRAASGDRGRRAGSPECASGAGITTLRS